MSVNVAARVQKHRDGLRAIGLRPVQIWVLDTRREEFALECRRQSTRAARADKADAELAAVMDAALSDVSGWT